jgi:hypothetical protein
VGLTTSQPITRPAGLHDDLPRKFQQVIRWAASEQQLEEFATEWRACFEKAIADDDLRPVSNVIEAWWRSLLARRDPRHGTAVKQATREQPGETVGLSELLSELGR